jgi:histidine triad (HIT) family protein
VSDSPFEVPQRDPCPFCQNIAHGLTVSSFDGRVTECAVVEALEATFSFISPRQNGVPHVLVIPTRHAATVLDLRVEEMAAVSFQVQRLAAAITRAFSPSGLNIYQNNGLAAGQSVGHYHVHVVPRYPDQPLTFTTTRDQPVTPYAERAALAARIRAALI